MRCKNNTAGLWVNPLGIRIYMTCSQAGSFPKVVSSVLEELVGVFMVVLFYTAVVLAQVCHSNVLIFLTLEFGHDLDLHRNTWGCEEAERCVSLLHCWVLPCSRLCCHDAMGNGSLYPLQSPPAQPPVLPVSGTRSVFLLQAHFAHSFPSLVVGFFSPTSFFLSFIYFFLLTALIIFHFALSVFSTSRFSLFLSSVHSNPFPWTSRWGC